MLAPSEPTIAPNVLAAYTPPTRRPGSCPRAATDASARGKLAPQRIAAGKTAQRHRTISSCTLSQGSVVSVTSTGQYGIDFISEYAAHTIVAHSSIWHQPSATRGFFKLRDNADPRLLPIPRPKRNAARISANV